MRPTMLTDASTCWSTTPGCNVGKRAVEISWDDWNLVLDTIPARRIFRGAGGGPLHAPARQRAASSTSDRSRRVRIVGLGPYGASRGGIKQLTMSLADDWGRTGSPSTAWRPAGFERRRTSVSTRIASGSTTCRSHSAEASGPARGSRRRGGLSRLRCERLHHRADAARRRRDFNRLDASVAQGNSLLAPNSALTSTRTVRHPSG